MDNLIKFGGDLENITTGTEMLVGTWGGAKLYKKYIEVTLSTTASKTILDTMRQIQIKFCNLVVVSEYGEGKQVPYGVEDVTDEYAYFSCSGTRTITLYLNHNVNTGVSKVITGVIYYIR